MATAKTKKKIKSRVLGTKAKAVKSKKAVAAKAPVKKTAVKKITTKKAAPKKPAPKTVTPVRSSLPTGQATKKESTSHPTRAVIRKGEKPAAKVVPADASVEQKLKALYDLQNIDSQIDKIRTVRGELPLEVRDLEDEIEGLETRVNNYTAEGETVEESIKTKKNEMKDAKALIKKYEEQQKKCT